MKQYILSLLLLFSLSVLGQTTSFIYYGIEEGLPQSQVQTLLQDNDGNLWIGTIAGLTRYNGLSFKNYSKKDSLAEDWITTSYQDHEGNIWFGHWAGGVSRYIRESGRIQNLMLEEFTDFRAVRAITQDAKNRYWIATEGAGIFVYDPVEQKMIGLSVADGLSSENVSSLLLDDNNVMWIGTDNGITLLNLSHDLSDPAAYSTINGLTGLHSNAITTLSKVNNSEVWIGSVNAGVMVVPISGEINYSSPFEYLRSNTVVINTASGLSSDNVKGISEDFYGGVWIATHGGGVCVVKPVNTAENRREAIKLGSIQIYSTPQGLNYFNANTVLEDREGNIWIGTDIGLNQFLGEKFQTYDEDDGLAHNIVWSTYVDSKKQVWLGTNKGLTKFTFKVDSINGSRSHTATNYTTANGLGGNVVLSIFEDVSGDMWFGTNQGGLSRLGQDGKFKNYTKETGLSGNIIYSITADDKGMIWIGTKEGADRLNPTTDHVRSFTTSDGLGGNSIYRIFKNSKGHLWFGSLGGSLSVYDGESFKVFEPNADIDPRFILSIDEDSEGNLWMGSYGGGLYKYDGKDFINFTVDDGMSTNTPYALLIDQDDNIWIGGSRGIDKFDSKQGFTHYGKKEGFLGVEVNPNSVSTDADGNIWFGSIMGAVRFNPNAAHQNVIEPIVSINGFKLFSRDTLFPIDNQFKYNQNHLTFGFVGVCLTNPEKVQYKYKLDGIDEAWVMAGKTPEASYSKLPPGEYVFQVMASNNDGIWSSTPASYRFRITPPFWKTIPFYILSVIVFVLLMFLGDKWRTRKLQEEKKILEDKVTERTQQLVIKNLELAERNKEIMDSIRYAKRIQEAILPSKKVINKHLKEAFVLYRPKDIVSGDFYWLEGRVNDKVLISAVDCTGHGVPGAFMSIVGYNVLNQTVYQDKITEPGKVLMALAAGVQNTLKMSASDGVEIKDGMDLSMCAIDFKNMKLEFSGAFNPLYHIRDDEFTEIKGDRIGIGGGISEAHHFSNHEMDLKKGDLIYLFSDGYADQFGGPNGKKFKSSQFKTLLAEICDKKMEEQQEILLEQFEKWRGDLEQVDDVLVIGIRI